MTPENFCYWLQGYFEIMTPVDPTNRYQLTAEQCSVVKSHLDLVFEKKVDTTKYVHTTGLVSAGKPNENNDVFFHVDVPPSEFYSYQESSYCKNKEWEKNRKRGLKPSTEFDPTSLVNIKEAASC